MAEWVDRLVDAVCVWVQLGMQQQKNRTPPFGWCGSKQSWFVCAQIRTLRRDKWWVGHCE